MQAPGTPGPAGPVPGGRRRPRAHGGDLLDRLSVTRLSPAWMARSLGLLYASGGCLAIVWTRFSEPGETGIGVVVTMAVIAVALGAGLLAGPTWRLPRWTFHAVIAVIQVVISVAYVASAIPDGDIRLFYAWATPYAAFFFGRRAALAHSVWTAGCLALSLVLIGGPLPASMRVWLMTVGTVAAVGLLVGVVAGRMRTGQALLHDAAVRDPLTGLFNRRGFATALDEALAARRRDGGSVVVLLIDLDHFKLVNDTHGHPVGDALLCEVAQRLVGEIRLGDDVARMGGDEFALVCRDTAGCFDVPGVLRRLEGIWTQPFGLEPGPLTVTGSIGVVTAVGAGETAESLLQDADLALYRAKDVQRGSAFAYDPTLRAGPTRTAVLHQGLQDAIGRDELSLALQPVVDLRTGRVDGAEALLRWTSPALGSVPPLEFIAVAEDRGLITEIGQWVIEEACGTLAQWRAGRVVDADFTVAVNVSGRQVRPGFAATVAAALRRHGLPPEVLHLEITESVLLDETAETTTALDELFALGTPMLLDDFGTGYSSLSYLHRLPLSGLKIDKSFVDHVHTSSQRRTVVSAILTIADSLGFAVVAEGVETVEVADTLRALGVRRAQGYLWARPQRADDLRDRLRTELEARDAASPSTVDRLLSRSVPAARKG